MDKLVYDQRHTITISTQVPLAEFEYGQIEAVLVGMLDEAKQKFEARYPYLTVERWS